MLRKRSWLCKNHHANNNYIVTQNLFWVSISDCTCVNLCLRTSNRYPEAAQLVMRYVVNCCLFCLLHVYFLSAIFVQTNVVIKGSLFV